MEHFGHCVRGLPSGGTEGTCEATEICQLASITNEERRNQLFSFQETGGIFRAVCKTLTLSAWYDECGELKRSGACSPRSKSNEASFLIILSNVEGDELNEEKRMNVPLVMRDSESLNTVKHLIEVLRKKDFGESRTGSVEVTVVMMNCCERETWKNYK